MAPQIEPGQFDDAPEDEVIVLNTQPLAVLNPRGNAAYIDDPATVEQTAEDGEHEYPPLSDEEEEEEDEGDSLLDEDEFYTQTRVEDEDWEIAERDFTKQYNRLRQHVAVKTGVAQGSTSATTHASVAALPAVNIPKSRPKPSSSSTSAAASGSSASATKAQSTKDRTISQLEAYAQKYTSRLSKIDEAYTYTMGVGVNRKGPSAHANLKDKSDRATSEQVLDPRTRLILFKMIGRGVIHEVNGCVSTGKEANVYHATTPTNSHLALKIYKTSILIFKDRSKYVTGEYRFRRGYSRNPRKMVRLWAEKEMRNLKRLRAAGIDSPEPLEVRENVLVMSFVGDKDGWASPRLKDAQLTAAELTPLYADLLCIMRTMFHTCKLVHADLSEYNILYHEGRLCVIDVSQSVEHDHPSAFDFLRSDIRNVEEFFGRGGVVTLAVRKAFEFVTREALVGEEKVAEVAKEDGGEGEGEREGGEVKKEETEKQKREREVLEKWLEERRQRSEEPEDADEPELTQPPNPNQPFEAPEDRDASESRPRRDEEHEDEIFMKSYIPRTLNEVYDPERDVEKLNRGEGERLIYAETIGLVGAKGEDNDQEHGEDGDEDDEGSEDDEEGEEKEEAEFKEKKPRGHRHEDKEAKKERKKAVKAEAKERRKTKMPKAEKKKLMKKSARSS